jgi:outer membrane protein TolC
MRMRRFRFAVWLGWPSVVASFLGLAFAPCVSAQVGAPPPPATLPIQVPLSGRPPASGSVSATESPVPSTTTSVNTLNTTVSIQGEYAGSARSTVRLPFSGKLSLSEAIDRGVRYNLGAVDMSQALRQASGQARIARSSLLPNLQGDIEDTEETVNLNALGINFSVPGFAIPSMAGPFNVLDLRARLTQTIADFTALNNYRSAKDVARAGKLSAQDAEDLVVLAVGGSYLQVIAANARLKSARSQLATAEALYQRGRKELQFGKATQLDVNRSRIELLVDQQRIVTLKDDLDKEKIDLARLTGLPPSSHYQLSSTIPYTPFPSSTLEAAIQQALRQRADLKAAEAQVQAAEHALAAARAERYPSLSTSADYGDIGVPSSALRPTFTVSATLNVPIFNGGRTNGDIQQADAALAQRRAELEDTQSQIESEVRKAYLDLEAAGSQVRVAQENIGLVQTTLRQERERFEAGVSENVDVIQSQESLSDAHLDYIDSVFAYNLAKLSLFRSLGDARGKLAEFLSAQPKP